MHPSRRELSRRRAFRRRVTRRGVLHLSPNRREVLHCELLGEPNATRTESDQDAGSLGVPHLQRRPHLPGYAGSTNRRNLTDVANHDGGGFSANDTLTSGSHALEVLESANFAEVDSGMRRCASTARARLDRASTARARFARRPIFSATASMGKASGLGRRTVDAQLADSNPFTSDTGFRRLETRLGRHAPGFCGGQADLLFAHLPHRGLGLQNRAASKIVLAERTTCTALPASTFRLQGMSTSSPEATSRGHGTLGERLGTSAGASGAGVERFSSMSSAATSLSNATSAPS